MSKTLVKSGRLDFFGSLLSIGCAIHCLAYPILLSLGSLTMIGDATHELTEIVFLIMTVSIGIWSFSTSYRLHGNSTPLILIALSFIIILFSQLWMDHPYETLPNIFAALVIASAHRANRHYLKKQQTVD